MPAIRVSRVAESLKPLQPFALSIGGDGYALDRVE